VPSTIPSDAPTQIPSEVPTVIPTNISTNTSTSPPTPIPTSKPTFSPTEQPTCIPSVIPTISPSFVPSKKPSVAPTRRPTLTPTVALTTLEFSTGVNMNGITADACTQVCQDAAITAMASSMSGVNKDQVTITEILDIGKRFLKIVLSGTESGIKISFSIKAYLELLGYSAIDANAAYESLTTQISSSVTSGTFQSTMIEVSLAMNSTDLSEVVVDNSTLVFGNYTVFVAKTDSPTMTPTSATDSSSNASGALAAGGIVGIVIGAIVIFGIACAIFYYVKVADQSRKEAMFRRAMRSVSPNSITPVNLNQNELPRNEVTRFSEAVLPL